MKPVILVNCDFLDKPRRRVFLNETYVDAVVRAGGIPLLYPHVNDAAAARAALDLADAVLFTGGDDLDPSRWGEAPHPTLDRMDPRKESADFTLIGAAEEARMPLLGICGGLQLLNVFRGGTLVQDVPSAVGPDVAHRGKPDVPAEHPVRVASGTRLERVLGSLAPQVNSAHHQAIARVGRGLTVNARSADGVIEGVEGDDPARFVLAVQWHPERIIDWPGQLALFEALVAAACAFASGGEREVTSIPL